MLRNWATIGEEESGVRVDHRGSWDQENFIFFKVSMINAFSHVDDNFLLAVEAEAASIYNVCGPVHVKSRAQVEDVSPRENQKSASVVPTENAD